MNTENNSQSTIDYEIPQSKFVGMLHRDCAREYMEDMGCDRRLEYFEYEVAGRNGTTNGMDSVQKIPDNFVIQQAAERYFLLVHDAKGSLHFNQQELTIILNTTCSPVWDWYANMSVAGMVADDAGVERLEELAPDSTLRLLIEKLVQLSPIQNVALVDVCERVWRSQSGQPFDELCAEFGLPLTD